jgi:phosphate starvation-inducible protein PhoH
MSQEQIPVLFNARNIDVNLGDEEQEQTQGEAHMAKKHQHSQSKMQLQTVKPLNASQEDVFHSFINGKHLLLHGAAGTGKTFISLFLALKELEHDRNLNKVIIVRSVVPSRDIGYLPGSIKEKSRIYEEPYYDICTALYERGDAYDVLSSKNMIEFTTTSFLRGLTFENAIVIVDEIQNMAYSELATLVTRVGENCRIVFCGDFRQTDLTRRGEREGLMHFMEILKSMKDFAFVEFGVHDIVRSKFVKSFIMAEQEYRERVTDFNFT